MKKISGKKVLLDTNIIIYQLNGKFDFSDYLVRANELYISAITSAELYAGVTKSELPSLRDYLSEFKIIPVTDEISTLAGAYKSVLKKPGLKDLIIAATAEINQLTLVTVNKKDFNGILTISPVFLDPKKISS